MQYDFVIRTVMSGGKFFNWRQRFKDNVNKYNVEYELYAYCILIEKNKAFDRIVQRNLVPEEHKMPPEVTLNYYDKLILPTKQEGFKEIFIINSWYLPDFIL